MMIHKFSAPVASGFLTGFISSDGEFIAHGYTGSFDIYIYRKQSCHSSCSTCKGGTANDCTFCLIGSAPSAKPIDFDNPRSCTVMTNLCATYVTGTSDNCLTCPAGQYLFKDTSNFGSCTPCTNTGLV